MCGWYGSQSIQCLNIHSQMIKNLHFFFFILRSKHVYNRAPIAFVRSYSTKIISVIMSLLKRK